MLSQKRNNMNIRCLDVNAVQSELQAAKAKTDQNQLQYQTELLGKRIRIASLQEQMKKVDTKLHAYSSALAQVQSPQSPPTYVLQKQALLCNVIHRMTAQARIVDMTKMQCTDIVRSVRQSMVDLEDECADIEIDMMKKIAVLEKELVQAKAEQRKVFASQRQEIVDMAIALGLEEGKYEEDTILDIDSLQLDLEEESCSVEKEFDNSLSRSLSKITTYFSHHHHHLSTKIVSQHNPTEEPHSHFFDSFSDLEMELSPEKSNDHKIGRLFHSLSNRLRLTERKLPEQMSAAPPVA